MKKKLFLFLFIFIFLYSFLYPIEITGIIKDSNDMSPLFGVIISIDGIPYCISDISGKFYISSIHAGQYIMSFYRLGYKKTEKYIFIDEEFEEINIFLESEPIEIQGVTVFSNISDPGKNTITIGREEIEKEGCEDLAELLEGIPGVTIRRQSVDGASKVVLGGAGADRVSIFLDGVKLNDPSTGDCDISMIPANSLESVKIIKGSFSGGDPGGQIYLTSRKNQNTDISLVSRIGSYGYFNNEFTSGLNLINSNGNRILSVSNINYLGIIKLSNYTGDYPVENYSYYKLLNNDSHLKYFFSKLSFLYFLKGEISILGSYSIRERGLPGLADGSMMTQSRLSEEKSFFIGQYSFLSKYFYYQLSTSFIETELKYRCPRRQPIPETNDSAYFYPDSTRIKTRSYSINNKISIFSGNRFEISGELSVFKEKFKSEDLLRLYLNSGEVFRRTYNPKIHIQYNIPFRNNNILLSYDLSYLYWEDDSNNQDFYSSSFGISWSKNVEDNRILLGCSWGKTIRLPNFLESYTVESVYSRGDPSLLPEKGETFGINAEGKGGTVYPWQLTIGFTWSEMRDRVIWRRNFRGQYQPYNLGKASSFGADFTFLFTVPLNFKISTWLSLQDVRNKTDGDINYNKYLTYRPNFRSSLKIEQDFNNISWNIEYISVGRRFTNESNTDPMCLSNVALPPYHIISSGITTKRQINSFLLLFRLKGENLFNSKYSLIQQMPTEGRTFKLEVEVKWQKD